MFRTLSGVSLMFEVYHSYSLHWSSDAYCTQNSYSQSTYHGHFTCSPMYRTSSKQFDPYVKTFTTSSGAWWRFWSSPQLNILCTSAVKLCYAKSNSSPLTCFHVPEFVEAEHFPQCSSDLNAVNFPPRKALQQDYIVKTNRSETLIIWSAFSYTA